MTLRLQHKIQLSVGLIIIAVLGTSTFLDVQVTKKRYLESTGLYSSALAEDIKHDMLKLYQTSDNILWIQQLQSIKCIQLYERHKMQGVVHFSVLNTQGKIVAHNRKELKGHDTSNRLRPYLKKQTTILADASYHTLVPVLTQKNIYLGTIDIGVSANIVDRYIKQLLVNSALLFFLFQAIASLSIYFLVNSLIIKPLKELTQSSVIIANGNLEKKISIRSSDEIGILAHSFTKMQKAIKETIQSLIIESEKTQRSARLSLQQQEAVIDIGARITEQESWEDWARLVTERTTEALEIDRASIWILNEDHSQLVCIDLYQAEVNSHSSNICIEKETCPAYFEAISSQKYVAAGDAVNDQRTVGFADAYLKPNNISSLLDTSLWFQGEQIGILCVEHVGPPREWTSEEIVCTERFAEQIALFWAEKYRSSLNHINEIIIESAEPEELCQKIADSLRDSYGCDRIGVKYEAEMAMGHFKATSFSSNKEWALPWMKHEDSGGIFSTTLDSLLNSNEPQAFSKSAKTGIPDSFEKYQVQSLLLLSNSPQINEKMVIALHQCDYEREWNSYDKKLLIAIAGRLRESLNRLLLAREVRKAEQYISNIIDSMPSTLIGVDSKGLITRWNCMASRTTGRTPQAVVGKPLDEIEPRFAKDMERIFLSIKDRKIQSDTQCIRQEGSNVIYEDITIYPLVSNGVEGAVIRIDDVTKEQLMEEQLNHKRKMEAVGTLAGGVAHDFNNMLGGILGATELLAKFIPDDPKANKFHKMILDSALRAADLTKQLLTFSRRENKTSTVIDLHDVIQTTSSLLKRAIDRRVTLNLKLDAERSTTIGDPSHLENMFLNLGINASHAMPDGGTITISSEVVELDSIFCTTSIFDIEPGEFIKITVRDSGTGIDPEDIDKIFDPFFTTKELKKGTGLGLSSVYGTIQQHCGAIFVYSEISNGTSFTILLPLTEQKQSILSKTVETFGKGNGCILVVDDEDVMRLTAKAVLEDFGFEIVQAVNGQQAFELYQQYREKIVLVILDMVMPVMNGRDCFKKLKEYDPEVRVILSSGFTQKEDFEEMKKLGLVGLIQKPYLANKLGKVVFNSLSQIS